MVSILLSGCSADKGLSDLPLSGNLTVSGTIRTQSRTAGCDWQTDDRIGVSGGTYSNIPYSTATGDGEFSPVNIENAIQTTTDERTVFTAYYPYNQTDSQISFSVTDINGNYTDKNETIDFLWAKSQSESGKVNFTFSHMMSALNLTLEVRYLDADGNPTERPEYFPEITEAEITLSPVITKGIFDTQSGNIIPDTETSGISHIINTDGIQLNLPPQSPDEDITVTAMFRSKQLQASIHPALSAGYRYSYTMRYTVSINQQNQPEGTLTVSQSSIAPWDNGTAGNSVFTEISPSDPAYLQPEPQSTKASVGDFLLNDGTVLASTADIDAVTREKIAAVVFYAAQGEELLDLGHPHGNGLALAINDALESQPLCKHPGLTVKYLDRFATDNTIWEPFMPYWMSVYTGGTETTPFGMHGYACTEAFKFIESNGYYTSSVAASPTIGHAEGLTDALNASSQIQSDAVSSWYLPSYQEFITIEKNYDIIRKSIVKAGGVFDYSDNVAYGFYWTSDQRDERRQWIWVKDSPQYTEKTNSRYGHFRLAVSF